MEKNCLVTTYKATVDDNSLLKVGEMFIDIIEQETPTNQTNRLYLNTNYVDDLVVEVENGEANITLDENMVSGWTNKISLPKSFIPAPVFVRNGNYRLKVSSKYNLTEVGRWTPNIYQEAISVDTKHLKHSPNMTTLLCGLSGNLANIRGCTKLIRLMDLIGNQNFTGSLSDLSALTSLEYISLIANQNFTGSLSDLTSLTAMKSLVLRGFTNANITGSLSDIASMTALTTLELNGFTDIIGSISDLSPLTALTKITFVDTNISGDIKDLRNPINNMAIYRSNITGELIEFVKSQRSAGRTTGSCYNNGWWGVNITFNGVNLGGGAQTLTWTENTITLGDTTVNQ